MQTQIPQSNKKNKVTVPFYSPPCRFYGQTSADIIKEAREAIMTTSPIGIKPVLTSRPFTPKQNERTLFGNIKRSKSRPPSSFSLSQFKNQEPSSRIKLPSINLISRKKNLSSFQYSKNLSLDNLVEDYDAEAFEEVKPINPELLPNWKKITSSPVEGRLTRVASMNDINNLHINNQENLDKKQNFEINQYIYNLKVNKLLGECITIDEDVKPNENNSLMTKGGGDSRDCSCDKLNCSDSNLEVFGSKLKRNSNELQIGDICENPTNESFKIDKEQFEENTENICLENKEENTIVVGVKALNSLTESKKQISEEKKDLNNLNESDKVAETSAEKSVTTEFKSNYLSFLQTGSKTVTTQREPVSVEIVELYETARYYGVDINDSSGEKISTSSFEEINNNLQQQPQKTLTNSSASEEQVPTNHDIKSKTPINKTAQMKTTEETIEFEMNNKKRYHMAKNKEAVKEKAYKKWQDKQIADTITPEPKEMNDNWDLFWKNSYFREKNDKEDENKNESSQKNLQTLVNKMAEHIKKGAESSEIHHTISQLYSVLKNNKAVLNGKLKDSLLKAIYFFVDNENAEVLLNLTKIFFLIKEENCLSMACKIIFKVARFDTNDNLFLNDEDVLELFLEGLGRASPLDCAESCIYGYGALKFLTLNHSILSRILHMGGLDLMTLHLKMINNFYAEKGSVGDQTQHALYQLTGALRHVAAGEGAIPLFLTTNCITIVCNTLRCFHSDEDVTINISRTLSLLSTDEKVIQTLLDVENILTLLVDLMDQYKENDKILIRLAFCLGNIVEHSDLARVQLSKKDVPLTVLLNILNLYMNKDLEMSLKEVESPNPDELSPEVVDDVIVKIIRIIANMSMNPIVGSNLSPKTKEKKSLQLSKLLSVMLMRKDPGIALLATLGCLNNISYYCNSHSVLIDITQGVERVLGLDSVECQIEAARVLGNLTRHEEIRNLIYNTGGVDLLVKLLSSIDQEVVRCACGALVNMMLDSETRKSFVESQGIDKLVKVLEKFPNDWSLASLATRAIWNSCGDDVPSALQHNNVDNILNILTSSLEEENWKDGDFAWEEFASVATDLLEKISSYLETI